MVINLNHQYGSDMQASMPNLGKLLGSSLLSQQPLVILLAPGQSPNKNMYWPGGLPDAEAARLIKPDINTKGVPTILLAHQPLWVQIVASLFHEYRHFLQHQSLPAASIQASNQQKWVVACKQCRAGKEYAAVPLEVDAAVYAYAQMKAFLGEDNQAKVDILFGKKLNLPFFKLGINNQSIMTFPELEATIVQYTQELSSHIPHHQKLIHQSTNA